MSNIDIFFERTYYKVIDYDTKEVIHEKEYATRIASMLGVKSSVLTRSNKKGYYQKNSKGRKYVFKVLSN